MALSVPGATGQNHLSQQAPMSQAVCPLAFGPSKPRFRYDLDNSLSSGLNSHSGLIMLRSHGPKRSARGSPSRMHFSRILSALSGWRDQWQRMLVDITDLSALKFRNVCSINHCTVLLKSSFGRAKIFVDFHECRLWEPDLGLSNNLWICVLPSLSPFLEEEALEGPSAIRSGSWDFRWVPIKDFSIFTQGTI